MFVPYVYSKITSDIYFNGKDNTCSPLHPNKVRGSFLSSGLILDQDVDLQYVYNLNSHYVVFFLSLTISPFPLVVEDFLYLLPPVDLLP